MSLLSRVERLEQASNATADALTIILASYADTPLIGYRSGGAYIERNAN